MAIRYTLDPGASRFTVQAFAGGMLSVFAHNPVIAIRDFTGELLFEPDKPDATSFRMTVRADSLEVTDNVRPQDRQEIESTLRREALETATYPEIVFRSSAVSADKVADNWYRLQLRGELTLHGVTNAQAVDAQLRALGDEVRLGGEFKLSLSAYRIKRVTAAGGLITLKDELKFSFDVVGRQVDER